MKDLVGLPDLPEIAAAETVGKAAIAVAVAVKVKRLSVFVNAKLDAPASTIDGGRSRGHMPTLEKVPDDRRAREASLRPTPTRGVGKHRSISFSHVSIHSRGKLLPPDDEASLAGVQARASREKDPFQQLNDGL